MLEMFVLGVGTVLRPEETRGQRSNECVSSNKY